MHMLLVCTMVATLCVDVGWKPHENEDGTAKNEKRFVIQIPPEQYRQMIKNGNAVPCGILKGVSKVWIQLGNEELEALNSHSVVLSPETGADSPTTSETSVVPKTPVTPTPPEAPATLPSGSARPPEAIRPVTASPGDTSPYAVVPTSLDISLDHPVPPAHTRLNKEPATTAHSASKITKEKKKEKEAPSAEKSVSYLTTAIVSWIVSAGLFALVLYIGWIHLDVRRRYQTLLNETLKKRPGSLPSAALPKVVASPNSVKPTPAPIEPSTPSIPCEEKPAIPQPPTPIPTPEVPVTASPSEEPLETSTPIESEVKEEKASEATKQDCEKPSTILKSPDPDTDIDEFDATERLLQNTNLAMTQATERQKPVPETEHDKPETVYELPDSSDGEKPLEEEDEEDRKGIE